MSPSCTFVLSSFFGQEILCNKLAHYFLFSQNSLCWIMIKLNPGILSQRKVDINNDEATTSNEHMRTIQDVEQNPHARCIRP